MPNNCAVSYTIYLTMKDGENVSIKASGEAIDTLTAAVRKAGARWNPGVESWDFGFYPDTPTTDAFYSLIETTSGKRSLFVFDGPGKQKVLFAKNGLERMTKAYVSGLTRRVRQGGTDFPDAERDGQAIWNALQDSPGWKEIASESGVSDEEEIA